MTENNGGYVFRTMAPAGDGCEETCICFGTLSEDSQRLSRAARKAAWNGKEFPGSLQTPCGHCAARGVIAAYEAENTELLKGQRSDESCK